MRYITVALYVLSSSAFADGTEGADARFYAGVGAVRSSYEGERRGIAVDDSSVAFDVPPGYLVTDTLGLAVAYTSLDVLAVPDIAGSGGDRLGIDAGLYAVIVKPVAELSLPEASGRQRDGRLYDAIGYARADAGRTVTGGHGNSEAVHEEESGLLLGAGVLYKLGVADLRALVERFDVLDEGEARDTGVAAPFSF